MERDTLQLILSAGAFLAAAAWHDARINAMTLLVTESPSQERLADVGA